MLEYIVFFNKDTGLSYGYLGKKPKLDISVGVGEEDFIAAYSYSLLSNSDSIDSIIHGKNYLIKTKPFLYAITTKGIFYTQQSSRSAITSFISFDDLDFADIVLDNLSSVLDHLYLRNNNFISNNYNYYDFVVGLSEIVDTINDPIARSHIASFFDLFESIVFHSSKSRGVFYDIMSTINKEKIISRNIGNSLLFNIGLSSLLLELFDRSTKYYPEWMLPDLLDNLRRSLQLNNHYKHTTLLALIESFGSIGE